jgi:hypothetical protein
VKLRELIAHHANLISWDSGEIHITKPVKALEVVLPSYFRHGKFTSLQRQLNNFGFTKNCKASGALVSVYSRVDMTGLPVEGLLCLRSLPSGANIADFSNMQIPADIPDYDTFELGSDWPIVLDPVPI